MTTRSDVALLLRRAGWSATPAELDAAQAKGYAATVEALLAPLAPGAAAYAGTPPPPVSLVANTGPKASPERTAATQSRQLQTRELTAWWPARMAATTTPLVEKLTWFWHTHFATSTVKVRQPALMLRQNQLFRAQGATAFAPFMLAVAQDPAMLIWLDAGMDKASDPNENFARECMELFTLGIGNYTETDVREAARAFTGWAYARADDAFVLRPKQHDTGSKTFLGTTGMLSGQDVIRIVTHEPTSARWIVSRLWSRFAAPVAPGDQVVTDLLPSYDPDSSLVPLLRAMLNHPSFLSPSTRTGLVRQPVEWVVATMRLLGAAPVAGAKGERELVHTMTSLGQVPFAPPSVGGWPANAGWLSSASSLARAAFAQQIVARADLSAVADAAPSARLDAAAHQLGVDSWTAGTAAVLTTAAGDPARLLTLALLTPEFVTA